MNPATFQPTCVDRPGEKREAEKLYAELRAADGRALRRSGFPGERLTESMGRNVQRLMAGRANHELPRGELALWMRNLPHRTAKIPRIF